MTHAHIDIVFDGPPGHESGRFVEVEDATGRSIRLGEWLQREDGYWALRIPDTRALRAGLLAADKRIDRMGPPAFATHGRHLREIIRTALAEDDAAESKLASIERPEGTSNSPLPDAPKQD